MEQTQGVFYKSGSLQLIEEAYGEFIKAVDDLLETKDKEEEIKKTPEPLENLMYKKLQGCGQRIFTMKEEMLLLKHAQI